MMKPSMETCGPCGAELLFLLGVSLQFEINCVSELGYRQNIHQSCGHLHLDRNLE